MIHNVTFGLNDKLGPACATLSRPVGLTCPPDCAFLCGERSDGSVIPPGNRCYADRCERRRPNVADNWARGVQPGYAQWERETGDRLVYLATRDRGRRLEGFRPLVGGDLCLPRRAGPALGHIMADRLLPSDGRLDKRFTRALARVCLRLREAAPEALLWLYTHAWRQLAADRAAGYLEAFREAGVQLFASVHTAAGSAAALRLGYRLAVDLRDRPDPTLAPATVEAFRPRGGSGIPVTVCPHQRGKVADCVTCGFCGRASDRHVGFILH